MTPVLIAFLEYMYAQIGTKVRPHRVWQEKEGHHLRRGGIKITFATKMDKVIADSILEENPDILCTLSDSNGHCE
jgi:hypothetical protein